MKSFEDALNEHKRLLTESLINFNEGQRVRKIMLDINSNSSDYEYYFQSGQQSKQAEVDELRKRINGALIELEEAYRKGIIRKPRCIIDSIKILKGEQS